MILSLRRLAKIGYSTEGVIEATLEGPARECLSRDVPDNAVCPACGVPGGGAGAATCGILYLRTSAGTRGTGANRGYVVPVHLACADWPVVKEGIWSDGDHRGDPVCEECVSAGYPEIHLGTAQARRRGYRWLAKAYREACWLCWQMALEGKEMDARDAEWRGK